MKIASEQLAIAWLGELKHSPELLGAVSSILPHFDLAFKNCQAEHNGKMDAALFAASMTAVLSLLLAATCSSCALPQMEADMRDYLIKYLERWVKRLVPDAEIPAVKQ
ncbi:MAG: hypothetical protein ACLP7P_08460 [Rhodomicrobium sp.]